MSKKMQRREFLRGSSLAALAGAGLRSAPTLAQSLSSSTVSPNDKVTVAFIGTGRMGQSNLKTFMKHPEVEVAAVCDVYGPNLDAAAKIAGPKAKALKDFRRVLEMKEIQAVVVASPDHWHSLQTILACQAGKDVYVEKPVSVYLEEGRRMVEAARRYKRIVQVGTQQRSGLHFQKAVDLIRNGAIGKVSFIRTWNYGNSYPKGIGNPPDGDPPSDLDWDLWLGPAPKVPFNASRFGVHPERFSSFRWFWHYAGGMMTDWGVHLLDIVQWAMNVEGPSEIAAQGGKLYLEDNRETPDTLQVTYQYPGFVCVYENRECMAHGSTATVMASASTVRWERCSWTVADSKSFRKRHPKASTYTSPSLKRARTTTTWRTAGISSTASRAASCRFAISRSAIALRLLPNWETLPIALRATCFGIQRPRNLEAIDERANCSRPSIGNPGSLPSETYIPKICKGQSVVRELEA